MLLFVFDGLFLLRFAERQFLALLFQLPPRFTRFEPVYASQKPGSCCKVSPQALCSAVCDCGNEAGCPALQFWFADQPPLEDFFQTAELGAEPVLRALRQANARRMDHKADKRKPFGTTVDFPVVVEAQGKMFAQPLLAFVAQGFHFLERTETEHVVHVAEIMADLLCSRDHVVT